MLFLYCLLIFQILNMAENKNLLEMEKIEDPAYDNFVKERLQEAQLPAPVFHTNNNMVC